MNLRTRAQVEELMDQPGLDEQAHQRALAGLRRLNWISGSSRIVWPRLRELARLHPDKKLRVLDVASGGGDVAIQLARHAAREGLSMEFTGTDISPVAVAYSRRQAELHQTPVQFRQWNALEESVPGEFDVIMCSLFLHHLSVDDAVRFLKKISQAAGRMILVNDLRRSRLGYGLAWIGCRTLSRSPIVRMDGPLSVRSAFTPQEAIEQARRAGMEQVEITHHWPQRFLLTWRKAEC